MADTEQTSTWARLEQITKITTGAIFAVYVLGFLVTSVYYSRFGVYQLNPLRPRVIGAGLSISMMFAAANAIGNLAFPTFPEMEELSKASQLIIPWIKSGLCILYTFLFSGVISLLSNSDIHPKIWLVTIGPTGLMGLILMFLPMFFKKLHVTALLLRILGFACIIGPACWYIHRHPSEFYWFIFWMLFAVVTTRVGRHVMTSSNELVIGHKNIVTAFIFLIVLVDAFALRVYPAIRPEWGGGEPILVQVSFSKDSTSLAGQTHPALLLDETDLGLYVFDKNLDKSFFIPRSSISLIEFDARSNVIYGSKQRH